ncbi:carboxypeptidase-like regulatory domain-containing protein [Winogradskyella maritima]|nr:carboxypeptidase-like regulatory domain-containing protein [Winogradskyella maritima]
MKHNRFGLKTLYLVLALFLSVNSYSQSSSVSGNVTSADDGYGLPGVNVIEKGTTNGTVTDFDGNYSLNVENSNAILVFSYIGFTTQEIPINGASVINATMTEDATALEEVVLVGYGTQIKREVTGSVQTVKVAELADIPVTQVTQKLQGQLAGVQINQTTGKPGEGINVRIRGQLSISGVVTLYMLWMVFL